MIMKVKVENKIYNVTVGPINDRPIRVDVEGVLFEVWPEPVTDNSTSPTENQSAIINHREKESEKISAKDNRAPADNSRFPKPEGYTALHSKTLRAPIPGVITAVYVTPGSEVSVGEELLKLEAMKMNNSILSNRAGVIRDVCITVGQVVKNNEILLEFAS